MSIYFIYTILNNYNTILITSKEHTGKNSGKPKMSPQVQPAYSHSPLSSNDTVDKGELNKNVHSSAPLTKSYSYN